MWFFISLIVVFAYFKFRKLIRINMKSAEQYAYALSAEAEVDLRRRGGRLQEKLQEVEELPLPSEVIEMSRGRRKQLTK